MIKLTEKVTGSPIVLVYPYPTKVKIQGQTQYNTLAHCRVKLVKLAKQRVEATTKTHVAVLDLFNLQSSQ